MKERGLVLKMTFGVITRRHLYSTSTLFVLNTYIRCMEELSLTSFGLLCYNFLLRKANMTHLYFYEKIYTICVLYFGIY